MCGIYILEGVNLVSQAFMHGVCVVHSVCMLSSPRDLVIASYEANVKSEIASIA